MNTTITKDFDISKYKTIIDRTETMTIAGKVTKVIGTVIEGIAPRCTIGGLCDVYPQNSDSLIKAEVVGFKDDVVLLMPYGDMGGLKPGSTIYTKEREQMLRVGESMLGRIIDGLGNFIDEDEPATLTEEYSLYKDTINPLHRPRITKQISVGIRAIDGLLTIGKGQRVGIMSGSGVGKSILLGMIARNTSADINVIGLIGERGREVKEFLERDLGEEGLKKSIVVVVTSDKSPLIRVRGAYVATAIAEYFSRKGLDVLLLMDSITRFATAQREIGLAIGEPPTTKGYTPSVFAKLPKLLERAGTNEVGGSVTAMYTVLVEGDDLTEPVSDAVRAILDGHIVLSRDLAAQHHYPAIDVLESKSRLMIDVVKEEHLQLAKKCLSLLATHKKAESLINIGAYNKGSNPKIDESMKYIDKINTFLQQEIYEKDTLEGSVQKLKSLLSE